MKLLISLVVLVFIQPCYADPQAHSADKAKDMARTFLRLQVPSDASLQMIKDEARELAAKMQKNIESRIDVKISSEEVLQIQAFMEDMLFGQVQSIEDEMVALVLTSYTQEELLEANKFLSSPLGKKIISKQQSMLANAHSSGREIASRVATPSWVDKKRKEFLARFPQWQAAFTSNLGK